MIPKNVQMPNPNPKYKPPGTPAGSRGGNLMDIEKLKDMLRNAAGGPVGIQMCQEAADALEQLQAENANLHDELEKVDAERDAAVNDLNILRKRSGWKCYACFYDDHYDRGVCAGCGYNNDNNWQWRGQKED